MKDLAPCALFICIAAVLICWGFAIAATNAEDNRHQEAMARIQASTLPATNPER